MEALESRLVDDSSKDLDITPSQEEVPQNGESITPPNSGMTRRGFFGAVATGIIGGILGKRAVEAQTPVKGLNTTAPLGVMAERAALPNIGANTVYGGEAPTPTPTRTPEPTPIPTPIETWIAANTEETSKAERNINGKKYVLRTASAKTGLHKSTINPSMESKLLDYIQADGVTTAELIYLESYKTLPPGIRFNSTTATINGIERWIGRYAVINQGTKKILMIVPGEMAYGDTAFMQALQKNNDSEYFFTTLVGTTGAESPGFTAEQKARWDSRKPYMGMCFTVSPK